jgi:hypothetical protein
MTRAEWLWVLAVCLVAAVRVFIGAAATPFFADTDEMEHFDLVHKFARGYWPAGPIGPVDPEVGELAILHGSPEYAVPPSFYATGCYPPPLSKWEDGPEKDYYRRVLEDYYRTYPNHEATSPPVYYAVAAAWYRLGHALGLSSAASVYWVEFLNAPVFAALVATAYFFTRRYFCRAVAFAASALIAFFPNTVFFTISSDDLSPLAGAASLALTLLWYERDRPGVALSVAAGAVAALAVLVKLSNGAALVTVAVVIVLRLRRDGHPRQVISVAWPLLLSALLPLFVWGMRNRLLLGDWTGTGAKLAVRGMSVKPLLLVGDHPLFTSSGLVDFLRSLCVSLFSGDMSWHGQAVHFRPMEEFFLVTSLLLPAAGLVAAFRRGGQQNRLRLAAGMSATYVLASIAELAFLSLFIDFGPSMYPSRRFPFYAFGRLATGALVPFFVLYAMGTLALFGRWPRLFTAVIGVEIGMMVLGQWTFLAPTISSQYNWFHLP